MSQKSKIEGFRPGKASYDVVKGRFGEIAILEEALPELVRKQLVGIITKDGLETIGEPSINVEKAAPGNEVVFTAKVAILPKIRKMADLGKIRIEPKETAISDEEVERVVQELRKMQSTEHEVDRGVRKGDKATVDMDMKKGGVAVEGGAAKGHVIYTDEQPYVPGFVDQLIGMKKDATKTFTLKFPKEHFQKALAGADVEFTVKLGKVEELRHPELDDAFAQKLGQKTLDGLRALLRKNLEDEAAGREKQRQEIAVMDALVSRSDFDEIPELLVDGEAKKMLHEHRHSIERQGLSFEDYLGKLGKKENDLLLDFAPEALKRVKSALLVRELGRREGMEPDDKEVVEEQARLVNLYKDDAETQERIRSEDGMSYIRAILRNRKVVEWLRETVVKK
jgi:trigger factor